MKEKGEEEKTNHIKNSVIGTPRNKVKKKGQVTV